VKGDGLFSTFLSISSHNRLLHANMHFESIFRVYRQKTVTFLAASTMSPMMDEKEKSQ